MTEKQLPKCPWCGTVKAGFTFLQNVQRWDGLKSNQNEFNCWILKCNTCQKLVIEASYAPLGTRSHLPSLEAAMCRRAPDEVREADEDNARHYEEACRVLPDSPMASALMSRRVLESLLKKRLTDPPFTLEAKIDKAEEENLIPAEALDYIHMIRAEGNFAAHPNEYTDSGDLIDVSAEDAEALIMILDTLFEHWFVRPAHMEKRKALLKEKIAKSSKPNVDIDPKLSS